MKKEHIQKIYDYVAAFPENLPYYQMTKNEDEIHINWSLGEKEAMIIFDSDDEFGYAYKGARLDKTGSWISGKYQSTLNDAFPQDLIDYLSE